MTLSTQHAVFRRTALAAGFCGGVLAAAGCSAGRGLPSPSRATVSAPVETVAPAPRPSSTPLVVLSPRGGELAVSATRHVLEVSGRGTPRQLLTVRCGPPSCGASAIVDAAGRWSTRLPIGRARGATRIVVRDTSRRSVVDVRIRRAAATTARHDATPQAVSRPAVPDQPTAGGIPPRVLVVGDSLAVGTRDLLPTLLPGISVETDALTSRPLRAGMALLLARPRPTGRSAVVLSLFTNDEPTAVGALRAAVQDSVDWVGPDGCAVWLTIVRPPLGGVSYAAANLALRRAAATSIGRLQVADWAGLIGRRPGLVARDGVHATPEGYRARATLIAEALTSCP